MQMHVNMVIFPYSHFIEFLRVLMKFIEEKMLSVRRPWAPSSNKPKDLKKTDKLLYSATVDTNQPITSDYLHTLRQQKKNSTVTFRYEDLPQFKNSLDKSKSISQVELKIFI